MLWFFIGRDLGLLYSMLASCVVIMLRGSEFSEGTAARFVAEAGSRVTFITMKCVQVSLVVITFTLILPTVIVASGLFGTPGSVSAEAAAYTIVCSGIVIAIYCAFALILALHVRTPAGSLACWLFYALIVERLVSAGTKKHADALLPLQNVRHLQLSSPGAAGWDASGTLAFGLRSLVVTVIVAVIAFAWFYRRDL